MVRFAGWLRATVEWMKCDSEDSVNAGEGALRSLGPRDQKMERMVLGMLRIARFTDWLRASGK
jgi:hypothetical protein